MLSYPDHLWNWLDFGHALLIFLTFVLTALLFHANLAGLWGRIGVVAFRSLDLLDHLYIVISEEMKMANFSISQFPSYRTGGIPDYCIVRLFLFPNELLAPPPPPPPPSNKKKRFMANIFAYVLQIFCPITGTLLHFEAPAVKQPSHTNCLQDLGNTDHGPDSVWRWYPVNLGNPFAELRRL